MKLDINNKVAQVDFGRAEAANSLTEPDWHALRDLFKKLSDNTAVDVILLTGAGKHFCSGMDLSVLASLAQRVDPSATDNAHRIKEFIVDIQDCITAVTECPQPVIAAIQGGCIGGGVAIATACDIRFATEDAYFVVKEVDFGIIPDIGTIQRLPRIIEPGKALELSLTGRKMLADEARTSGLVSATFKDYTEMMEYAKSICQLIASKDQVVTRGIKAQHNFARINSVAQSLDAVATRSSEVLADRFSA